MLGVKWKRAMAAALTALVIWQTLGLASDIGVGKAAAAAVVRSWQLLGSGAADNAASANSVTIATYGNTPYIAYNDDFSNRQIRVKYWASGAWQTVGNNGSALDPGTDTGLEVAPNGRPFLAFLNSSGHPAVLSMDEQQNWDYLGAPELSANSAIASDISVSADGQVYVAYEDSGNSFKAMMRVYESGVWSEPEAATASRGMSPSLTLDADGKPTLAYSDSSLDFLPRVMSRIGMGNWTAVASDNLTERGYYAMIRAASDGSFYLAYLNGDTSDTGVTKVWRFDGTSWTQIGSFDSNYPERPLIAVDPIDSKPIVAYIGRPAEASKVHVLKWNGGTWDEIGQTSDLPANAASLSLAIGADGTPYVAYLDGSNHNAPTVIGYLPDMTPPSITAQNPAPGEFDVPVNANLSATFIESIMGVPGHDIEICTTASTECQHVDAGSASVSVSGDVANIDVPVDLRGGTSYRAVAEAGTFADLNGNPAPVIEWTFTTAATVPNAPEITDVFPGNGEVGVLFSAPASNGGSAITGYTVTIHPLSGGADIVEETPGMFYTRSGLTIGVSYSVTVTAKNSVGTSVPSAVKTFVPSTVPSAPTITGVVVGNRKATVSFEPSASDGFSPITYYKVQAKHDGVLIKTGTGSTSPIEVIGLTNGQTYSFTVVAVNANGESAPSEALSGTPGTVPAAPTNVTATGGDGQATVSFTPSVSNGGSPITGYRVTTIPGNTSEAPISVTVGPEATSAVVTGLRNGGDYEFKVVALNALGASLEAQTFEWAHVGAVPEKPFNLFASAGDGKATVSFDEPDNGGRAIANYRVTAWAGADAVAQVEGLSSPIEVTGLQNGTVYTFTVEAYNEMGWSPVSDPSAAVTPGAVPGAPTIVTATAGNGTATVSFNAPASNGGSPITGYTVTANPGGAQVELEADEHEATFTGLTNGTPYTFTVVATNARGNSAASDPSTAVTPMTVPGAPTNVTATAGNGTATVSFTAPASNGGSPITGYSVTANPGGAQVELEADEHEATFTGLTNGTSYTFTVVAINVRGNSAASDPSAAVTPGAVPGAPTNVTAMAGNGTATVSFTAPASDGGNSITGYTVTASPGGAQVELEADEHEATITGLTNGTPYTFTVVATNARGNSAASDPSAAVTPSTVPGTPTNVTAKAGNGTVTVSFNAPTSNGGCPITGYTVTVNPGGAQVELEADELETTFTGLTNGTSYTFTVVAINTKGASDASSPSVAATPSTVPGVPTGVSAMAGNGQATISFTLPTDNGGSQITEYRVTAWKDGQNVKETTGPSSPITVMGLMNGTSYTFAVVAINANGASAASSPSAAVTPMSVPGAPTNVTATTGNGQATVSFTPPSDNGGSPITEYRVTAWKDGQAVKEAAGSSSPITVTGLTNGTAYTFTVVAINANGASTTSSPSAAVTSSTVPGVPTGLTASAGNGQATVSFTPPSDNGGRPITEFRVTVWKDGQNVKETTGPSSPVTVSGLTNGTVYTFTVAAVNANGASPASVASASVTPSAPATSPGGGGGSPSNTYAVNVTVGGVQLGTLNVRRETLANGNTKDTLEVAASYAEEAAAKLKAAGESRLPIVLSSASSGAAELVFRLPKEAAGALADAGISLELRTREAEVAIPAASLQNATDPIQLTFTPLSGNDRKSELQKRAESSPIVRSGAGDGTVTLIGNPVDIATDLRNRTVMLTLPADTDASDIGVYIEHSDGTVELVRGKYLQDGPGGKPGISFEMSKFSAFAVVRVAGWDEFGEKESPSQQPKTQPYISGYAGGMFKPNASLTRAEMAAILAQAFAGDASGATQDATAFSDVPGSHWAADAVRDVAARGLMSGYPDGTFRPDKPITRAEMAALLSTLTRSTGNGEGQGAGFADTDGHWAQAAIREAQADGLISGYEDGTFRPDRALTRAEAVVIINKLLHINPNVSHDPFYADVPKTHWAYGAVQAASKR